MKQRLLTISVNTRYQVIFACLYWRSQGKSQGISCGLESGHREDEMSPRAKILGREWVQGLWSSLSRCLCLYVCLSVGSVLHLTCRSSCWRGTVFMPTAVTLLSCYISYIQCFCYYLCSVCMWVFVSMSVSRYQNFPRALENNSIKSLTTVSGLLQQVQMYYGSGTVTHTTSRWRDVLGGRLADAAAYAAASSSQRRANVMAAIFKVCHRKSDYINRCLFTWTTMLQNFIGFYTTER